MVRDTGAGKDKEKTPRWALMARRLYGQAAVGRNITSTTYRKAETPEELIDRFCRIMRERYGGTLYLFGSRARGTAGPHSDYDFVAVSKTFEGQKPTARVPAGIFLWLEAGGWGEALDLHCYAPEEFRQEVAGGIGYLGQARRRGELIRLRPSCARAQ